MRVAISGAHGVGKTTLGRALAIKTQLPFIEEVARRVAKSYRFKNTQDILDASEETKRAFQAKVLITQVFDEAIHRQSGFISDRSVLDIVAYMELYEIWDDYITLRAIKHTSTYDMIIYCPIPEGAGIDDDGFRLTTLQKEYDEILRRLVKHAQCEVLYLPADRRLWLAKAIERLERGKDGHIRQSGSTTRTAP